jgi:hypothetical protein
MKEIKIANMTAIVAILVITAVFFSIISPLKELGILKSLFIFPGILIWGISLILITSTLKIKEKISKSRFLKSIFLF